MEDYYDDVGMPGSRLKIGFHGDEKNSEQIFIIPFMDGDDVKYFVVRGLTEGDERMMRCDMVRVMDWDQLIEYLGEVWEELWDATLFKLTWGRGHSRHLGQGPPHGLGIPGGLWLGECGPGELFRVRGFVEEVRDRRSLRELERVFRSCDMLVLKIA